jgi:hypothetical protein
MAAQGRRCAKRRQRASLAQFSVRRSAPVCACTINLRFLLSVIGWAYHSTSLYGVGDGHSNASAGTRETGRRKKLGNPVLMTEARVTLVDLIKSDRTALYCVIGGARDRIILNQNGADLIRQQ